MVMTALSEKSACRKIRVHDTTLRDGTQMQGTRLSLEQKEAVAQGLAGIGVSMIETMPLVPGEEEFTKWLVKEALGPETRALVRMQKADIEHAVGCGVDRALLMTSYSDGHLKHKLRTTKEANLEQSLEMVDFTRSCGLKVDFVGEDASRADAKYVVDFAKAVKDKIEYFMVTDTVGCWLPSQAAQMIRTLKQEAGVMIEAHFHNDFGLATANTLAALDAGAESYSGCMCGYGERGGNASTEEVSAAWAKLYGGEPDIQLDKIKSTSELVAKAFGREIQPNQPLIGRNAFSHEAGLHVASVLVEPSTYEGYDPAFIGQERKLYFGRMTGKKALKLLLENADIRLEDNEFEAIHNRIRKSDESLTGGEVLALVGEL